MNTLEKAIDRVRKLLALSKSDNPNEAAQASARAQEILDRYELDAAMIESEVESGDAELEDVEDFCKKDAPLKMAGKLPVWQSRLADSIARANGCRVYLQTIRMKRTIQIVGRASDVSKVRYLFAYLVREIDRLVSHAGRGCGRTWCNNYRLGAVDTIGESLRAVHARVRDDVRSRAGNNPQALMVANTAIAKIAKRQTDTDAYVETHLNLTSGSTSYSRREDSAYAKGQTAGRSISIGAVRGALGAGRRALP